MGLNSDWTSPQEPHSGQDRPDPWKRLDAPSAERIAIPPTTRSLPWWRITRDALGVFLVTRLAYALVTYFAVVFSINSVNGKSGNATLGVLLRAWQTGDVTNYLTIAAQGYTQDYLTAFFPLYPLLIRIFALGHSGTFELAVAMVISNLGSLAALIGLGLLAAHEYGTSVSMSAIRALIAFPLAFFLVMGYADNLFLALVIFALFFARRGAWGGAIACVFVSALLRPTGVTLTLPLLWEYGRQQGWWMAIWAVLRRRQTLVQSSTNALRQTPIRTRAQSLQRLILYPIALLVAAPAGVALFAAYCWRVFGDPLIFLQVQQTYFARRPTPLPDALLFLVQLLFHFPALNFLTARNLIDLAPVLIFIALVGVACARRQISVIYLLYILGVFYADLAAPMIGRDIAFPSAGRHMLLAVPIFLLLGKWSLQRPWLDTLILSLGFVLQGVFLVAVMHGNLMHFNAID